MDSIFILVEYLFILEVEQLLNCAVCVLILIPNCFNRISISYIFFNGNINEIGKDPKQIV